MLSYYTFGVYVYGVYVNLAHGFAPCHDFHLYRFGLERFARPLGWA